LGLLNSEAKMGSVLNHLAIDKVVAVHLHRLKEISKLVFFFVNYPDGISGN